MKHESGIEVYLRPVGDQMSHLKYPELEHKQPASHSQLKLTIGWDEKVIDYSERYMQCFTPYIDQGFEIVIRFTEDFDAFTASAINVGVAVGCGKPSGFSGPLLWPSDIFLQAMARRKRYRRFHYTQIQKSQAMGQQVVIALPDSNRFILPKYRETTDFDRDEVNLHHLIKHGYQNIVNPGTTTIVVQRGNADWLDEAGKPRSEQSKLGLADPQTDRPCQKRSFVPLKSRNGDKIRFEFRPRSSGRLAEVENILREEKGEEPLSIEEASDPTRRALIPDEGYATALQTGNSFRRHMKASWLRRLSRAQRPKVIRRPTTCQCSIEQHQKTATVLRKQFKRPAEEDDSLEVIEDRPAKKKRPIFFGRWNKWMDVEPRNAEWEPGLLPAGHEEVEETEAKTCGTCQKHKEPPRGKKFSWAAAVQKWVYVNETAQDSFQPEDEVAEGSNDGEETRNSEADGSDDEAEDSDDEARQSENEELETSDDEAETSDDEAETSDDEAETSDDEAETSDDKAESSDNEAESSEDEEAESSDDEAHRHDIALEESESKQRFDHADGGEAAQGMSAVHMHFDSVGQGSNGSVLNIPPSGKVGALKSGTVEEQSSRTNGAHNSTPLSSAPIQESLRPFSNGTPVDGGAQPELPPASVQFAGPDPVPSSASGPSKKSHRSIVDLSKDIVEELKYDQSRELKQEYGIQLADDSDEEELRAKLDQNRLKLQAVELRMEAADLERKLKQKAAAKRRAKVKQEVIELD